MEPHEDRDRIKECAGLLGLSGALTPASLKAAYHRAMLKWHPDLHHGKSTMKLAAWNAVRINEARDFLAGLPPETPLPGARKARAPRPARPDFEDPEAAVHRLKSEMFSAVAYNDATRTLYLKFQSGATYKYLGVPRPVFTRFLRSRSKHSFAKNRIFSSFAYSRC